MFRHAAFQVLIISMLILLAAKSNAFDEPAAQKPFMTWLWEDQFQPTLKNSIGKPGIAILSVGALSTVLAHEYDDEINIEVFSERERYMNKDCADFFSKLGAGPVFITIALGQIYFDRENGLMHARSIVLTSLTHVSLAYMIQRERPNQSRSYFSFASSFPSGHAAAAFASASSLAYAYGWEIGVPAFATAVSIAVARVSERKHWFSDVVAGATIGLFWANASRNVTKHTLHQSFCVPFITEEGGGLAYLWQF